jgi:serine protease AprX
MLAALALASACGDSAEETPLQGEAPQAAEQATITDVQSGVLRNALGDDSEPSLNKLFSVTITDGKPGEVSVEEPPIVLSSEGEDEVVVSPELVVEVLHPRLQRDIDDLARGVSADRVVDVVVTFREDLAIPRFPDPHEDEPEDSPTNQLALRQSQELESAIVRARAPGYDARSKELATAHRAVERDRFWLINAMLVEVPLSEVGAIARRDDVQQIEYRVSDAERPAGSVADARAIIQSDPFANITTTNSFMALLDSGVRASHTLLGGTLGFVRDCVSNTNATCSTGTNVNDTCNHGTATAAVLAGNSNLGNASRGVTPFSVDSFKTGLGCGIDIAATVRGYQAATSILDRVIIDENQDTGSETGAIATAANAAFDAGAVVISAAGNAGPGASSIRSPFLGHPASYLRGKLTRSWLSVRSTSPVRPFRASPDVGRPSTVGRSLS